jgi:hypothetical protein
MKLQFTDDLKPLIENYTALEVPVDRKTAAEVTKAAEKLGTIQKRRRGRLHRGLSGPYADNVPELTNPGILPALLRIATRCDAPPKHGRPLGVYVCICAIGQEQTCRIEDIFFYKYS